ncbi:replication fork protection component Swi3-domain-containing protein [Limtongia smithiae]|uniref:replication fork protection component Swi3-domain-containing protein n=1 Tax=Limtongia smithiae TaxID=1125753 RepID=UPI0034CD4C31
MDALFPPDEDFSDLEREAQEDLEIPDTASLFASSTASSEKTAAAAASAVAAAEIPMIEDGYISPPEDAPLTPPQTVYRDNRTLPDSSASSNDTAPPRGPAYDHDEEDDAYRAGIAAVLNRQGYEYGDDGAETNEVLDIGIDKEVTIKAKREVVKLDEERLLSSNGLLQLRRQAKRVRLKGRGHEYGDLGRIIECYKLWAHQLFPRSTFADFLTTTELLGRTARMRAERHRWIDETKPLRGVADSDSEEDDVGKVETKMDMPRRGSMEAGSEDEGVGYDDGTGFIASEDDLRISTKRKRHDQDDDQRKKDRADTEASEIRETEQSLFLINDDEDDDDLYD